MNENTMEVYRVDRKMQKKHGLEQVRASLLQGSEQLDPEIQKRYKIEIDRIIGSRYDAFQGRYESDFENEKDTILKFLSDELLEKIDGINDEITAEILTRRSRGGGKNTEEIKNDEQQEKTMELKKEIHSFFSDIQHKHEERIKEIKDAKNTITSMADEAVSETLYEYTAAKVKLGHRTDEPLTEKNPDFDLIVRNVFNKFFVHYEKWYKQIVQNKKMELDMETKEMNITVRKKIDSEWELQHSQLEEIIVASLKLHVIPIIKTRIPEMYHERREQIPGLLRIPSESGLDLNNVPTETIQITRPQPPRKKISDIFRGWFGQKN